MINSIMNPEPFLNFDEEEIKKQIIGDKQQVPENILLQTIAKQYKNFCSRTNTQPQSLKQDVQNIKNFMSTEEELEKKAKAKTINPEEEEKLQKQKEIRKTLKPVNIVATEVYKLPLPETYQKNGIEHPYSLNDVQCAILPSEMNDKKMAVLAPLRKGDQFVIQTKIEYDSLTGTIIRNQHGEEAVNYKIMRIDSNEEARNYFNAKLDKSLKEMEPAPYHASQTKQEIFRKNN